MKYTKEIFTLRLLKLLFRSMPFTVIFLLLFLVTTYQQYVVIVINNGNNLLNRYDWTVLLVITAALLFYAHLANALVLYIIGAFIGTWIWFMYRLIWRQLLHLHLFQAMNLMFHNNYSYTFVNSKLQISRCVY